MKEKVEVELYGDADEPVFWSNEKSGRMKEVVQKFFDHKELDKEEFTILKWYVKQWINKTYLQVCKTMETNHQSDPGKGYEKVMKELANKAETITDVESLRVFVSADCLNAGIDPF
jgi:hypothetical protein